MFQQVRGLTPEVRAQIERAAAETGTDPAYMMAVAERESGFDTNAKASKTIYGMYQMTGPTRRQYGMGDSQDPYEQSKAFGLYTSDLRKDMGKRLGRDPSWAETYTGHHFGPGRASSMLKDPSGNTSVADVFTPYELSLNPHIVRAGTTGALRDSTVGDMTRRMGKYGGQDTGAPQPAGGPSEPFSFARYGEAVDEGTEPVAQPTTSSPPSTGGGSTTTPLPARERSATRSPAGFAAYGVPVPEKADEAPVAALPTAVAPEPTAMPAPAPQQVAEAAPPAPPQPEPPQAAPPQEFAAAATEADEAPSLDLSAHTKWRRAQEA